MPRLARVVVPDLPHHVTQRGNRRQRTFFVERDYQLYKVMLAEQAARHGVRIAAWCLMPNHVHLVLVPSRADALARCLSELHRRYTADINAREGWRGYLWQGRFASTVLDETHFLAALRYVALNPVRAGLVAAAADWRWSSARCHLHGQADGLTDADAARGLINDWAGFLAAGPRPAEEATLRSCERTGRAAGAPAFVKALEERLGRRLRPGRPGPRVKPTGSGTKD